MLLGRATADFRQPAISATRGGADLQARVQRFNAGLEALLHPDDELSGVPPSPLVQSASHCGSITSKNGARKYRQNKGV